MIQPLSIVIATTLEDENWIVVHGCIVHEVVNVVKAGVAELQTDGHDRAVAVAAVAVVTTRRPGNVHIRGSADNLFKFILFFFILILSL